MKIIKTIETKSYEYELTVQSLNNPSHSIADDYKNVFGSIVEDACNLIKDRLTALDTIIEHARNRDK